MRVADLFDQVIRSGDPAQIDRILAEGCDVNRVDEFGDTPLSVATCWIEDPVARRRCAQHLHRRGALAAPPPPALPPLVGCVIHDDLDLLQWLLQCDADPNADCSGENLYEFAEFCYVEREWDLESEEAPDFSFGVTARARLAHLQNLARRDGKQPPVLLAALAAAGARCLLEASGSAEPLGGS